MNIYPRNVMSLSLTNDEREKIAEIMKQTGLNQHAVIKLCIRYTLFPDERDKMPINGYLSVKEEEGKLVIKDEPRLKISKRDEEIVKFCAKESIEILNKPKEKHGHVVLCSGDKK